MTAPLRVCAVGIVALAIAAFTAGLAHADPNSPRINFFACAAGGSNAKAVPANTPLYIQSGFSSGTRGLVEASRREDPEHVLRHVFSRWQLDVHPAVRAAAPESRRHLDDVVQSRSPCAGVWRLDDDPLDVHREPAIQGACTAKQRLGSRGQLPAAMGWNRPEVRQLHPSGRQRPRHLHRHRRVDRPFTPTTDAKARFDRHPQALDTRIVRFARRVGVVVVAVLVAGLALASSASPTPPGRDGLIAYVSHGGPASRTYGIVLVKADGSGRQDLTTNWRDTSPAWSPDGARLVFVRAGRLYVIGSNGSGLRWITPLGLNRVFHPAWSSDGRSIVFGRGPRTTARPGGSLWSVRRSPSVSL